MGRMARCDAIAAANPPVSSPTQSPIDCSWYNLKVRPWVDNTMSQSELELLQEKCNLVNRKQEVTTEENDKIKNLDQANKDIQDNKEFDEQNDKLRQNVETEDVHRDKTTN